MAHAYFKISKLSVEKEDAEEQLAEVLEVQAVGVISGNFISKFLFTITTTLIKLFNCHSLVWNLTTGRKLFFFWQQLAFWYFQWYVTMACHNLLFSYFFLQLAIFPGNS